MLSFRIVFFNLNLAYFCFYCKQLLSAKQSDTPYMYHVERSNEYFLEKLITTTTGTELCAQHLFSDHTYTVKKETHGENNARQCWFQACRRNYPSCIKLTIGGRPFCFFNGIDQILNLGGENILRMHQECPTFDGKVRLLSREFTLCIGKNPLLI